jgi:hypothetical protein
LVVDAAAIIGALVPIEVVLVNASYLKKVVASQQGQVIPDHVVLPIPEAGTGLLGIYVERTQILIARLA